MRGILSLSPKLNPQAELVVEVLMVFIGNNTAVGAHQNQERQLEQNERTVEEERLQEPAHGAEGPTRPDVRGVHNRDPHRFSLW